MQLSTKGRYAVRAMADLAQHGAEGAISRAEIAERQGISADYLAHLFRDLHQAGLVISIMGPGGGYRLSRPAGEIRVGDVVRAVEGPIALVDCVSDCGTAACPRAPECLTRPLWEEISRTITGILDGQTLQSLIERQPGAPARGL